MPFTRSQKGLKQQELWHDSTPDAAPTAPDIPRDTSSTIGRSASPTTDVTLRENEAATDKSLVSTVAKKPAIKATSESRQRRTEEETSTIRGNVRRAISSSTRTRKRQELEARAELARRQLELAKIQLELAQFDDDEDSVVEEPENREDDVQEWVQSTMARMSGEGHVEKSEEGSIRQASVKGRLPEHSPVRRGEKEHEDEAYCGTKDLAEAIMKAISAVPKATTTPPAYLHELPAFDGTSAEWLAFKTVYEDTATLFSTVQNMARLRKAIKGTAREAIKSLLYSECLPSDVMEALRRRFGRPDALILAELDKIKNLPKITENARDVCVFASAVNNTVATVRGLKKPQYLYSPEMLKSIVEKMPAVLKFRWYDFATNDEEPDLLLMAKFLNREADRCGKYALQDEVTKKQFPQKQFPQKQAAHTVSEQGKEKTTCPHCQDNHHLFECSKFLKASTQERWEIAMKSKSCFKCLRSRHRKESCRKPPCKICKRWHHQLLHEDKPIEQDTPKQEEKKEVANNIKLSVNATKTGRAYLKMITVEIYGPKGSAQVLALLDEGSTVTLLDSSVADQVGLMGPTDPLSLETVGGRTITKKDSMRLDTKIRGIHQTTKREVTGVRTIDDLQLTPQMVDRSRIEGCAHLSKLANQLYYEGERPKLLIGQDNWELIVSRSTRKGKKDQPVASLTRLGWVLHGTDGGAPIQVNFVTCAHASTIEEQMDKLIRDHFAIESLGVQPRRPSMDMEAMSQKILEKTTRRLENGQFEAGLLWKNDREEMPNNYKSAENRLKNIEKKLDKDIDLKLEYGKQIQNLLSNKYAEEVQQASTSERKWYLPHFAVTHPTKKKIRVVFDAAAKFGGKSLNDALLTGPDLLQSLFGILLRFRQHPVAVVADIKEMFLQVKIRTEDRDSLRFLWRGDQRTGTPKEYRMTSVIFGASCSPSTAIYVMNRNAIEFQEQFPEAARAVVRNHYMDDYLQSFKSEEEAIRVASQVDTIHKKAGFHLRGWVSNRPEVLKRLTRDEKGGDEVELGSKEEKTLGLRWFTQEDEMGFRTCLRNVGGDVMNHKKAPTKRMVTSAVMSTFDPMGLASPVLIQGKRLLQDIWRSGIGWDDVITPENEVAWRNYIESLQLLRDLRVPRLVTHCSIGGELHTFTDASEGAYACAVYWRQRVSEGRYHVTLLAGKARVTPLKPVSIPRLELQAALLGTRLALSVERELDIKPVKKIYWTDSSTVLSWIRSDPRTFKPFVAHRLAEIEEASKPQEWRWVPTTQNPADDATRNIPQHFCRNHRWFTGPTFLGESEELWPESRSFKAEPTGEEKEKFLVATVKTADMHATPNPTRFSQWNRLLRATARILHFIELCKRQRQAVNVTRKDEKEDPTWKSTPQKHKKEPKSMMLRTRDRQFLPLESRHLERAEKLLLERSQEESFREDTTCIRNKKPLSRASKLRKLALEDDDGVLRIQGRIDVASSFDKNFRRPVVLDSKHHITKLLIEHYHKIFNHGNHATVMNELRQRYWVLGLRSAVRSATHRCQWCRVYKREPHKPPIGDLPKERLHYGEPAFTFSGVDFFGPMMVTVGRRHEKRWGALFTCLSTRAVSVELAASLSSDSMILALRRMAARRGMPKGLFSDNGTNFVKANKELQEALKNMKQEDVIAEAEKIGVRWKFLPPGAPNMGGAWERLVRSIKTALAVTLRERYPKEEVLHTLLLEAEHIVNSRPLVETMDDVEEALTPNHFLIGRSCGAPRLGTFTDHDLEGRRTWKTTQRLADHFWSRWVKEYLPTLIPRRTDGKSRETRDLQCGDAVLIVDSTLPRNTWPRGEVVRTYPGPDGRTRVVEVRTTGGTLRRPSSKIVLLVPVKVYAHYDDQRPVPVEANEHRDAE